MKSLKRQSMIDVLVKAKNKHCALCGIHEDKCGQRYALRIRTGRPAILVPSKVHSAVCRPCWIHLAFDLALALLKEEQEYK